MAARLDVAAAADALKTFYSKDKIETLVYQDRPLFAMLDKKTDFVGDKYKVPLKLTNPQGRSGTFTNAQAQKSATQYKAFYLTRVKDYSLASIETEAILASQNDAGAFLRLATGEIDGALDSLTRSIAWKLYGDGSGSMGAVASMTLANPGVITLGQADDIVKFEVGQTIEAWNGGVQQSFTAGAASSVVVAKVDRDAGTITLGSSTVGAAGTFNSSTTLNVVGDHDNCISGLAAWIPASAPTASAFFEVDRSVDVVRLGGLRKSYVQVPIEEAIIDMARKIGREGGQPSHLFLSFDKYTALEKSLGTKVMYDTFKVGEISFTAIKLNGPKGTMSVVADQDCPSNRGYMLDMKHWSLYTLGQAVQIIDLDGNKMLREASADAMEIRCAFFGQLGCRKPLANGVMLF